MKKLILVFLLLIFLIPQGGLAMTEIKLPQPRINKNLYLDQTIQQRRSVRSFKRKNLTLRQISQLLWAAQGITDPKRGLRAAPSAGAIYPLTLYLVKNDAVWKYNTDKRTIKLVIAGDLRERLTRATFVRNSIPNAPLYIVIVADYKKITAKYTERGIIYAHIETGHVAQNLALEAVALGLASVPIGAFQDDKIENLLNLPIDEDALYIIPIGYKK